MYKDEDLMKRIIAASSMVLCGVIATLFLTGCNFGKKQTPETLKVINVLDKNLYDDCHIKGSVHVPFEDVENKAMKWDKSTKIVVYCSNYTCTASGFIAKMLLKMGFEHVWAYEAGMVAWYQAGLPCDGPARQEYLKLTNNQHENVEKDGLSIISTEELKNLIEKELHLTEK